MERHGDDKTLHCFDLEEGVKNIECIGSGKSTDVSLPKNDGRLFVDETLYCEGHHRPLLRGIMHLVCSLAFPTVLYLFIEVSRGSSRAIFASTFYIMSNMFCYGISGIYHVFQWSKEQEIKLQKLDHCGITILSVGTIVPDALLLLPFLPYGLVMISISSSLCLYACGQILRGKASMKWQMAVAIWWVLPYLLPNFMLMTSTEFTAMISTCLFQTVGAIVFATRRPNPHPPTCGYHEVFHFFVVMAGISVIICNYSIVRRYGESYWLKNHT